MNNTNYKANSMERRLTAKLDKGQRLTDREVNKMLQSKQSKKKKRRKKRVDKQYEIKKKLSSDYVKGLRCKATKHERILRDVLNNEHIKYVFQQRFIGKGVFYIVDFYFVLINEDRLVVEIDGDNHNYPKQKEKDRIRDAYFKGRGMHVLRFTNQQVEEDVEYVINKIAKFNPKCWDNEV